MNYIILTLYQLPYCITIPYNIVTGFILNKLVMYLRLNITLYFSYHCYWLGNITVTVTLELPYWYDLILLPLVPVIIYIQDLLSLSMYQPFVSIWILGFYSPVSVVLSFTLFAHRVVTPPLITTRRRHDRSERGTWETKDGPDRRRKRVEKPWGERSEASGA